MDSLTSVSKPSIVFPPSNPLLPQRRRLVSLSLSSPASDSRLRPRLSSFFALPCSPPHLATRRFLDVSCKSGAHDDADDLERALHLDGTIPGTSNEFVKHVSSRAYDMRRHLQQTFDSSSYDVLEANPWRETSKHVYVLTHKENQLCTMKTRRNRSEVERELELLFSKGGKWRSKIGNQAKQSKTDTKFQMLVEDIREGVLTHNDQYVGEVSIHNNAHGPQARHCYNLLIAATGRVFEDENEAAKYCDLLQGGGQGCEGVAEIDASSVFDLCQKMRALAVLFRRGRTPPLPESLQLNLRARKRSLEDQDDSI